MAEGEASKRSRTLEVLLFERSRVVVPEAVDADDVVAVGEQPIAKVRPDESRRSGDYRANCLTCLAMMCSRITGGPGERVSFRRQRAAEIAGV